MSIVVPKRCGEVKDIARALPTAGNQRSSRSSGACVDLRHDVGRESQSGRKMREKHPLVDAVRRDDAPRRRVGLHGHLGGLGCLCEIGGGGRMFEFVLDELGAVTLDPRALQSAEKSARARDRRCDRRRRPRRSSRA